MPDPVPFEAMMGPSYTMFSPKAEIQKSMNCRRERVQSGEGVGQFCLLKSSGILPYLTEFKIGAVRGMMSRDTSSKYHAFIVVDDTLYDVRETLIDVDYGPIIADANVVYMACSPTTLMIVSAGHLYRVNGGTLVEIIPAIGLSVLNVKFIKNYFIVLYSDLQQFGWSEDDGATFPADNVQSLEADANATFTMDVIDQQIVFIGTRIGQWYSVTNDPNAPFVPNDGAVMRSGTRAPASLRALGTNLLWLESNQDGEYRVMMTQGYTPVPVSNLSVENAIRTYAKTASIDDAIGLPFLMNGQEFYRLTFPAADKTWEYNKTLNEWYEVSWRNRLLGTDHRHRMMSVMSAFGKILVGDHTNGIVYEMSPDIYHDAGYPILYERRSPHVVENNNQLSIERLELGMETGVGLDQPLWLQAYTMDWTTFVAALAAAVAALTVTAAQALILQDIYDGVPYVPLATYPDADTMNALGFTPWGGVAVLSDGTVIGEQPMQSLEYSTDGGKSYSAELRRTLGAQGDDVEVFWNSLGTGRDRVTRIYGSHPCKLAITQCWLEIEEIPA